MECQVEDRAIVRTPFRAWAAFAVILLIAQFVAGACPLRGQEPSRPTSDPFESLRRRLNFAADEQLARVSTGRLAVATVPRSIDGARSAGWTASFHPEVESASRKTLTAEQRFQLLGVDAGKIFREEGVPVALLRIAQVESNWKPFALSPKGAFGLWQLMPTTARRYGLRVDAIRDDRADIDKATRAAARYLRDLELKFGDWALTLAAYNAGEDAVERAMERGESSDFWNLSRRRLLPAETRAYVPAVLAALDQSGTERTMVLGLRPKHTVVAPRTVSAGSARWDGIEEPRTVRQR